MRMEQIGESLSFGGRQLRFRHHSNSLDCEMTFSVYLPPAAAQQAVPVLYWLSGLTCTDENFIHKAGAQRYAAEHGIAIVAPDTSPRGEDVPDDPEAGWDFGLGAGFYVNATEEPWRRHYQMYEYVLNELPTLVVSHLPVLSNCASIAGHSMGGHGALVLALRNATRYRSVSAFAPIVAPSECPWGQKALGHYLGKDTSHWQAYDSCALIAASAPQLPMLVDQGTADGFLNEQLRTPRLIETCIAANYPATIRMQAGYDHSYHFVATFVEEHIAFHAEHLYG